MRVNTTKIAGFGQIETFQKQVRFSNLFRVGIRKQEQAESVSLVWFRNGGAVLNICVWRTFCASNT